MGSGSSRITSPTDPPVKKYSKRKDFRTEGFQQREHILVKAAAVSSESTGLSAALEATTPTPTPTDCAQLPGIRVSPQSPSLVPSSARLRPSQTPEPVTLPPQLHPAVITGNAATAAPVAVDTERTILPTVSPASSSSCTRTPVTGDPANNTSNDNNPLSRASGGCVSPSGAGSSSVDGNLSLAVANTTSTDINISNSVLKTLDGLSADPSENSFLSGVPAPSDGTLVSASGIVVNVSPRGGTAPFRRAQYNGSTPMRANPSVVEPSAVQLPAAPAAAGAGRRGTSSSESKGPPPTTPTTTTTTTRTSTTSPCPAPPPHPAPAGNHSHNHNNSSSNNNSKSNPIGAPVTTSSSNNTSSASKSGPLHSGSSKTVFKPRALAIPPPKPSSSSGGGKELGSVISSCETQLPRPKSNSNVAATATLTPLADNSKLLTNKHSSVHSNENPKRTSGSSSPFGGREDTPVRLPMFVSSDQRFDGRRNSNGLAQSSQLYRPKPRGGASMSAESMQNIPRPSGGPQQSLSFSKGDANGRSVQVVTVSSPRGLPHVLSPTRSGGSASHTTLTGRRETIVPDAIQLNSSASFSHTDSQYSQRRTPENMRPHARLTCSEDVPLDDTFNNKTLRDAKAVLRKHAGGGGGGNAPAPGASLRSSRGLSFRRSRSSSFFNRSMRRDESSGPNTSTSRAAHASKHDLGNSSPRLLQNSSTDVLHPIPPVTIVTSSSGDTHRDSCTDPLHPTSDHPGAGRHRRRSEAMPLVEMLNTSLTSMQQDDNPRRSRLPPGMLHSTISDPAGRSQHRYGQSFRRNGSMTSRASVISQLSSPSSDELHEAHEKKVNEMFLRLTANTDRPTSPTAMTVCNNPLEDDVHSRHGDDSLNREAASSWAGIGSLAWGLTAVSGGGDAPAESTTTNAAFPSWNVAGGGDDTADSDDWYARMRRKAEEEEESKADSQDWYARMRKKVEEEEKADADAPNLQLAGGPPPRPAPPREPRNPTTPARPVKSSYVTFASSPPEERVSRVSVVLPPDIPDDSPMRLPAVLLTSVDAPGGIDSFATPDPLTVHSIIATSANGHKRQPPTQS